MLHLRVRRRERDIVHDTPAVKPGFANGYGLLGGHRFQLVDVFEVDLLGNDLDATASSIWAFPIAALNGAAYPNSLRFLPGTIDQVLRRVPESDRHDIDTSSRIVDTDGHQVSDETGARVEYPQLSVDRKTAAEDDEIEIHRSSPLHCPGIVRQYRECQRARTETVRDGIACGR
jgi:hypothetical protein